MRQIMLNRQAGHRRVAPLFTHDAEHNTWHLNYHEYGDISLAMAYAKRQAITLDEWRMYADKYRQGGRRGAGWYASECVTG
jgi:hypothetical protein